MKSSSPSKTPTKSTNFTFILLFVFFLVAFYHHLYHDARSALATPRLLSTSFPSPPPLLLSAPSSQDDDSSSSSSSSMIVTKSVLIPDWEVLVIAAESTTTTNNHDAYACVFNNKAKSPAIYSGGLPFTKRIVFKCEFPASTRRRLPFYQPILTRSPPSSLLGEAKGKDTDIGVADFTELMRWNFLVYESFTTENDVVLFVKGINKRQGVNRPPSDFHCVFGDDAAVRTAATTSFQEVFRCPLPPQNQQTIQGNHKPISISLEIDSEAIRIPSVARFSDQPTPDLWPEIEPKSSETKSMICACTMMYNAAKFLKEWVMYHASIGIDRFIIYDNESDNDLGRVIADLVAAGYDVKSLLWIWPKAQEAGFSHCALLARKICTWIAFIDVDEFILSPSWLDSPSPSPSMLRSLLIHRSDHRIGQISITCNEFGPSDQTTHPIDGVTQGYTCRRRLDQRHKSIVLVDSIDLSLMNAIHHFELKPGYKTRTLGREDAVVNHYKYQAWTEFRAKFRRRVSAYVVDWRQNVNLLSKDRAPGIGSEAVKPVGWERMFCEVRDERLRTVARRWFAVAEGENGTVTMAWQR